MNKITKVSYSETLYYGTMPEERHRKRPLLDSIASMSDDEIVSASVRQANKKAKQTTAARVLKNGPSMFIAATSIAYGALTKGKLTDKAFAAAKILGLGALVCGISKPVTKAVNHVVDKVTNDKKDHPLAKALLGFSAVLGASALALAGIRKGSAKIAKTFEPSINQFKKSLSKKTDWINNSTVGKFSDKMTEGMQKFENNHPKMAEFAKKHWITPLFLTSVGMTFKAAADVENFKAKETVSNIQKLAAIREIAKEGSDTSNVVSLNYEI